MSKKKYPWFFLTLCLVVISTGAWADETELFSTVQPDALILLDLSGSMGELPNGASSGTKLYVPTGTNCGSSDGPFYITSTTAHNKGCSSGAADSTHYGTFPVYSTDACTEPYYKTSSGTHTYNCTKIQIAKRAVFDLLDDDNNGIINSLDMTSLGVRIGFMRYWGASYDETSVDYSSGNNVLIQGITTSSGAITPYSSIYCGNNTAACTTAVTSCGSGLPVTNAACVANISASGNTPLITAMSEIKQYLDAHKASDSSRTCRKKFAIIITDGEDTVWKCGSTSATDVQRHRKAVLQAKMLNDAGYSTFVVGFGSMQTYLQNVLNWMAYYGGTDNPMVANSALPATSFNTAMDPCSADSAGNDPGTMNLTGYAFFANNASELTQSLKYSFSLIKEATYSFSANVSVAASRTADENYLYATSFQPVNSEPFWPGYLKQYQISDDGTVGSVLWEAGNVLKSKTADSRSIYTYKGATNLALTSFIRETDPTIATTGAITYDDLNIDDSASNALATYNMVIGFIRGESAYNIESWKLGDIFRSNPVSIPTPSKYFNDTRDTSSTTAYENFAKHHIRATSSDGNKRLMLIGANDGQLHAFKTVDGSEAWSFIPPNFLPKLINIAHNSHPTGLSHLYFVDGFTTVADVWIKGISGENDSDTAKKESNWRTLAIIGEGRGMANLAWSSSASCTSDFKSTYATGYENFCGYHALDVTNTPSPPTYAWHLIPTYTEAPYLGEPWSRFMVSRVIIAGEERWVGFIGAGYNPSPCTSTSCEKRGKGFLVIDLKNGSTVWSFTNGGAGYTGSADMQYSVPANPLIIDADGDGFADTAYIGDIGGNIWRFRFCASGDPATCNTTNWRGSRLYQRTSGSALTIYTAPTATKDPSGNLWIYWGTGDKVDPVDTTVRNKFFAVKDTDFTSTWSDSNLENIDTTTYTDTSAKHGWYLNLATGGEKVLYDPTVYGGVIYFTTYLPDQSGDPCSQAGTSNLWGINYLTGAGMIPTGTSGGTARSKYIGTGMASGVIISQSATGVASLIYEIGGVIGSTTVPSTSSRTNILYWRDSRVK